MMKSKVTRLPLHCHDVTFQSMAITCNTPGDVATKTTLGFTLGLTSPKEQPETKSMSLSRRGLGDDLRGINLLLPSREGVPQYFLPRRA